jgi:type IV secretion system protein VirD4
MMLLALALLALLVAMAWRPSSRREAPARLPRRVGRWLGTGPQIVIRLGRWRGVALAPEQSLLVVGATRSGKTQSVVLPNLVSFPGPVVVTSVKQDVLAASARAARSAHGQVLVLGANEIANCRWDPAAEARSAECAAAIAHSLVAGGPRRAPTSQETRFWLQLAEPLVAACLRGAFLTGHAPLGLLERPEELYRLLAAHGEDGSAEEVASVHALEERQRDSILLTVREVLLPFARFGADLPVRVVDELLAPEVGTVCLVADLALQERFEVVFATLLARLLATLAGAPQPRPWLVILDELANLAPVPDLERFASVGVGHGVRLVSVVQDLAQLRARYPSTWGSIVNNHRARLFLGASGDPLTRSYLESLAPGASQEHGWLLLEGAGPLVRLMARRRTAS